MLLLNSGFPSLTCFSCSGRWYILSPSHCESYSSLLSCLAGFCFLHVAEDGLRADQYLPRKVEEQVWA